MSTTTSRGYSKAAGADNATTYVKTTLGATMDLINADMVTALAAASGTLASNLTFTGTGRRILADLTNATDSNRLMFQTSTANSTSFLGLLPSGTSTNAQLRCYNTSDPDNAGYMTMAITASAASYNSNKNGSGTALDITFLLTSVEALRLTQTTLAATFAGQIIGSAGTTARATLRIPTGAAPTSPVAGDFWSEGTSLKFRDSGGTTRTLTWT